MMAAPAILVVFCTCPDRATAERLARAAVTQGAAACVNLLPGVTSVYTWAGAVETAEETLLVAKTSAHGYAALEALWLSEHPYELPEIIAVPVATGLPAYLQWITDSVSC